MGKGWVTPTRWKSPHDTTSPPTERFGPVAAGDLSPRDKRDAAPQRRGREGACVSDRGGGQRGARPDGPGEPPTGGEHRSELHGQGFRAAGSDRGRQPGAVARR